MARRHNHYEVAFEECLRARRTPYVAVDETRRALFEAGSLKSFDFLVAGPDGPHRLIDVKGRLFPAGGRRYWTNWLAGDDLAAARAWEEIFGSGFRAAWVFAYDVLGVRSPTPDHDLFSFRDRRYGFLIVDAADYVAACRRISPRWRTVSVPGEVFRRLARPLAEWLSGPESARASRATLGPTPPLFPAVASLAALQPGATSSSP